MPVARRTELPEGLRISPSCPSGADGGLESSALARSTRRVVGCCRRLANSMTCAPFQAIVALKPRSNSVIFRRAGIRLGSSILFGSFSRKLMALSGDPDLGREAAINLHWNCCHESV